MRISFITNSQNNWLPYDIFFVYYHKTKINRLTDVYHHYCFGYRLLVIGICTQCFRYWLNAWSCQANWQAYDKSFLFDSHLNISLCELFTFIFSQHQVVGRLLQSIEPNCTRLLLLFHTFNSVAALICFYSNSSAYSNSGWVSKKKQHFLPTNLRILQVTFFVLKLREFGLFIQFKLILTVDGSNVLYTHNRVHFIFLFLFDVWNSLK